MRVHYGQAWRWGGHRRRGGHADARGLKRGVSDGLPWAGLCHVMAGLHQPGGGVVEPAVSNSVSNKVWP